MAEGGAADGPPVSAGDEEDVQGLQIKRGPIGDWAERFVPDSHRQMLMEAEHMGRYAWAGALAPGKDVLDAGCGMGYGPALLKRLGASTATGVDVEEEALDEARKRFGSEVEFVRSDLALLPFEDESFDLITCFEVIEHVPDQARALDHFARILRPGGVLVISSPNRGVYPPGNPWHLHEYTPEEMQQELGRRFENVRLYGQSPQFCSLIADLETLESDSITEPIASRVHKLEGNVHGGEQYTIGVASDGPLPELENATVVGGGLDVKMTYDALLGWEGRARRAEAERELEMLDRQRAEMIQAQLRARLMQHEPGPTRTLLRKLGRRLRSDSRGH